MFEKVRILRIHLSYTPKGKFLKKEEKPMNTNNLARIFETRVFGGVPLIGMPPAVTLTFDLLISIRNQSLLSQTAPKL